MDPAPALCIVGDLGVTRNPFSASLSRSTNELFGKRRTRFQGADKSQLAVAESPACDRIAFA